MQRCDGARRQLISPARGASSSARDAPRSEASFDWSDGITIFRIRFRRSKKSASTWLQAEEQVSARSGRFRSPQSPVEYTPANATILPAVSMPSRRSAETHLDPRRTLAPPTPLAARDVRLLVDGRRSSDLAWYGHASLGLLLSAAAEAVVRADEDVGREADHHPALVLGLMPNVVLRKGRDFGRHLGRHCDRHRARALVGAAVEEPRRSSRVARGRSSRRLGVDGRKPRRVGRCGGVVVAELEREEPAGERGQAIPSNATQSRAGLGRVGGRVAGWRHGAPGFAFCEVRCSLLNFPMD